LLAGGRIGATLKVFGLVEGKPTLAEVKVAIEEFGKIATAVSCWRRSLGRVLDTRVGRPQPFALCCATDRRTTAWSRSPGAGRGAPEHLGLGPVPDPVRHGLPWTPSSSLGGSPIGDPDG
jgi:hypothetical protein